MARWVRAVHLVERHHKPVAHKAVPKSVHDCTGEKPGLPRLEPHPHKLLAPTERRSRHRFVFLFQLLEVFLLRLLGFLIRLLCGRLVDRRTGEEHQPRLLFDSGRGLETHQPVLALTDVVAILKGTVEKRFHPVIVILLPARHLGVIVALRATDIHTKKIHADVVGQPVEIADAVAVKLLRPLHSLGV